MIDHNVIVSLQKSQQSEGIALKIQHELNERGFKVEGKQQGGDGEWMWVIGYEGEEEKQFIISILRYIQQRDEIELTISDGLAIEQSKHSQTGQLIQHQPYDNQHIDILNVDDQAFNKPQQSQESESVDDLISSSNNDEGGFEELSDSSDGFQALDGSSEGMREGKDDGMVVKSIGGQCSSEVGQQQVIQQGDDILVVKEQVKVQQNVGYDAQQQPILVYPLTSSQPHQQSIKTQLPQIILQHAPTVRQQQQTIQETEEVEYQYSSQQQSEEKEKEKEEQHQRQQYCTGQQQSSGVAIEQSSSNCSVRQELIQEQKDQQPNEQQQLIVLTRQKEVPSQVIVVAVGEKEETVIGNRQQKTEYHELMMAAQLKQQQSEGKQLDWKDDDNNQRDDVNTGAVREQLQLGINLHSGLEELEEGEVKEVKADQSQQEQRLQPADDVGSHSPSQAYAQQQANLLIQQYSDNFLTAVRIIVDDHQTHPAQLNPSSPSVRYNLPTQFTIRQSSTRHAPAQQYEQQPSTQTILINHDEDEVDAFEVRQQRQKQPQQEEVQLRQQQQKNDNGRVQRGQQQQDSNRGLLNSKNQAVRRQQNVRNSQLVRKQTMTQVQLSSNLTPFTPASRRQPIINRALFQMKQSESIISIIQQRQQQSQSNRLYPTFSQHHACTFPALNPSQGFNSHNRNINHNKPIYYQAEGEGESWSWSSSSVFSLNFINSNNQRVVTITLLIGLLVLVAYLFYL